MPKKNKTVCKRRKCQRSRRQRRRQNNNRRTRTIRGGISPFRKFSEWNTTRRTNAAARRLPGPTHQPARWYSPVRMWQERNKNRVVPVPTTQTSFADLVQRAQNLRYMTPAQQQAAMAEMNTGIGNAERAINSGYDTSNAGFGAAARNLENRLAANENAWRQTPLNIPDAHSDEVNGVIAQQAQILAHEGRLKDMARAGKKISP